MKFWLRSIASVCLAAVAAVGRKKSCWGLDLKERTTENEGGKVDES